MLVEFIITRELEESHFHNVNNSREERENAFFFIAADGKEIVGCCQNLDCANSGES